MRRRQHGGRREKAIYTPSAKSIHSSPLHTTISLNNWQLCVHLTILLLPIAGGTSDTVYTVGGHLYSIQAQYTRLCVVAACAIYVMRIGQSI